MKFWEAMKALEEGKKIRCLDWEEVIPSQKEETESSDVCKISINWMELIKTKWELYREPMSEWISVKDLPPPPLTDVLLYDGKEIAIGWNESVQPEETPVYWTMYGGGLGMSRWFDDDEVTHWMPLPEPPTNQI